MKTHHFPTALLALAILTPTLHAETANEREFKQMRAERDKAAAAALEPINRRYQDGLERLSKRAAAEPELAKAIQAELQVLGGTTAATAAVPTAPAPATASASAAGATADKATLRKLFEETEWVAADGKHTYLFRRGGEMSSSDIFPRFYTVEAPDIVNLYHADPRKDRKADVLCLRVNVAEKTAQHDAKSSTRSGSLSLKYVGPAKAAK